MGEKASERADIKKEYLLQKEGKYIPPPRHTLKHKLQHLMKMLCSGCSMLRQLHFITNDVALAALAV